MKVIGAGFGKTGTMSLKVALETLGFDPCYHVIEVFRHPEYAAAELRRMIVVVRALSLAVLAALALFRRRARV